MTERGLLDSLTRCRRDLPHNASDDASGKRTRPDGASLETRTCAVHPSLRMHRRLPSLRHRRLFLDQPARRTRHIRPNCARKTRPARVNEDSGPTPAPRPESPESAPSHPTQTTSAAAVQAYSRRTAEKIVRSSRTQIRLLLATHRTWFEFGHVTKTAQGAALRRRPCNQAKNRQAFTSGAANSRLGDSTLKLSQVGVPVERRGLTGLQGCQTGSEAAGETLAVGPSAAPRLPV